MESKVIDLENPAVFCDRFRRGKHLLYDMGVRVLGSSERVEEAIQNCFIAASRNPSRVRSDGAFYSWLVRILIDEALLIRRQDPYLHPEQVNLAQSCASAI